MIVLGIDPGTAIVGYGLVSYEKNKYKVIDYGCIYTDKTMSMSEKLEKIYNELELIIKLYKPDAAACEELFFFKNEKTVIAVGQARGVILLCAQKNKIPLRGYTPLQVKMGITGYGKSDKRQVQDMVKKLLGLKEIPKPDDAADGLALAITHINSLTSGLLEIEQISKNLKNIKSIKTGKITAEEFRNLIKK